MPESIVKRWAEDEGFGTPAPPEVKPDSEWAFDPNQPRDRKGRWRETPGGLPTVFPDLQVPDTATGQLTYQEGPDVNTAVTDRARVAIAKVADPPGSPKVENMDPMTLLQATLNGENIGGMFQVKFPDAPDFDPDDPGHIEVNPENEEDEAVGSLIHETGHWLDYNEAKGGDPGRMATETVKKTPALEKLTTAIFTSPTQEKQRQYIDADPGGGSYEAMVAGYLTQPAEAFGRAWAEYVETEGGTNFDTPLFRGDHQRHMEGAYWDAEEFKPIAEAMKEWIEDEGWAPASTT